MTSNEFEAWVDALEDGKIGYCRYCGAELQIGEIDICDGCFDSEQIIM